MKWALICLFFLLSLILVASLYVAYQMQDLIALMKVMGGLLYAMLIQTGTI